MNEKPPEDPKIAQGKALVAETQRYAEAMWQEVIRSRQLLRETRRLLDATKPK
jgi:hypothetical protein